MPKTGSYRGGSPRGGGPGRSGMIGVVNKPSGSGRFNKPVKTQNGPRMDEYKKLDKPVSKMP